MTKRLSTTLGRFAGGLSPSPGTPGEGWGEGHSARPKSRPHPNPLPEYRERGQEGPHGKHAIQEAA